MEAEITYSTPGVFTMGELRALVNQQEALPDEAGVRLKGESASWTGDDSADVIQIVWEDA